MNHYNEIEITFKSGRSTIWDANKGEWDDYAYDGKMFIVVKNGVRVGFYNVDHIISAFIR